jgi:pimeloyl-ACP methyl ester carboxylesterase
MVTLADGRSIAFTDLGAPDGPVVIYSHAAPSSRLDLVAFGDAFLARGVRVISPDRPGYGRSTPLRERRREDWPADVAALADSLGVTRFAVIGLSSGGPYALACAASLPDRVHGVGVVSGDSDFGWDGAWQGYMEDETTLMRMPGVDEAVAWCRRRYGDDGGRFLDGGLGELPLTDRAALEEDWLATSLMATVTEAFRQGVRGYAQDLQIQGMPWRFDPRSIVAPVIVLHGEADTLTPVAHARHTAGLIPWASLRIRSGQGHFSVLSEIPPLTAELVAQEPTQEGRR